MKKNFMPSLIAVAILIAVIGAVTYYSNQPRMAEAPAGETAGETENKTAPGYTGALLAGSSAPLLDFKKADYDVAVASGKLVVLYFYANWCPVCRVEFPIMQGAFDKLTTDEVVGFRVNYKDNQTDDDERELAREFGIAYQHTKVFLRNGERVLKSPETWGGGRYIEEINKALAQ